MRCNQDPSNSFDIFSILKQYAINSFLNICDFTKTAIEYMLLTESFCLREQGRLGMKVGRYCLELVHKDVMWTYAICQSFSFNNLFFS